MKDYKSIMEIINIKKAQDYGNIYAAIRVYTDDSDYIKCSTRDYNETIRELSAWQPTQSDEDLYNNKLSLRDMPRGLIGRIVERILDGETAQYYKDGFWRDKHEKIGVISYCLPIRLKRINPKEELTSLLDINSLTDEQVKSILEIVKQN